MLSPEIIAELRRAIDERLATMDGPACSEWICAKDNLMHAVTAHLSELLDEREQLVKQVADARREVIEECARLADDLSVDKYAHCYGRSLATRIRAIAEREPIK